VLEFRVRAHDSKLEASRRKSDELLATEKRKKAAIFFMNILRNFPYVPKLLDFKQCFICTEMGLETAAPETLGFNPSQI